MDNWARAKKRANMAIGVSQILSEKAIKKLGLDKDRKTFKDANCVPVQEWDNEKAYWDDWEKEMSDRRAKWYVKVANFFKYSIGWRTRDWWWNTKWYFSNLRTFRPILKEWRSYSYEYQVDLFKFGIKQLAEAKEYYGNEEEGAQKKRIEAMKALITEIERDYEEDVRKRLKYDYKVGGKVTKYSDGSVLFHNEENEEEKQKTEQFYEALKEERKAHYNKIFSLIIGQDEEFVKKEVERRIAALPEEKKRSIPKDELYYKIHNEVWDGSGIEGWWD